MNKFFAIATAATLLGAPAMATEQEATITLTEEEKVELTGFYIDVNNTVGWFNGRYDANVTEPHIGYEGTWGEKFSYYIQGGPSIQAVEGEATTTQISGYVGGEYAVSERVAVYGEFYATSLDGDDADSAMSLETGVTFRF